MTAENSTLPGPTERDVFLGALGQPAGPARQAYLEAACRGDSALRQHVEALLIEHDAAESFLETPALGNVAALPRDAAAGPHGTALLASVTEKAGDRIGRYRLLQQVGEGGCGVVYMAEQEEPVRRRVALKVIKLGMDTRSVIARFDAERQALAMMEHENIARVLDAGSTEAGRPFFVMELVRGVRITEYCDRHRLSPSERIQLFIQVCNAVQHAHQKGIIHRDLKPSNILVTLHDGRPVPKIIDFGIAKATEQRLTEMTLFTAFAAFIGTPAYMSPEQAEMSGLDIDTRTDIYSLGVILYELLTGRTPFNPEELMRDGIDACRRTIRERDPERPSTRLSTLLEAELTTTAQERQTDAPRLVHLLRGDLDWIVMKCLEKDRTRRYATANELALDLQRYLDSEPVLARPPSDFYRLRKFFRRHRLVVTASSVVAAAILTGSGVSIRLAIRATEAEADAKRSQREEGRLRKQAEQEKAAARLNEYIADMGLAQQSISAGNYGRAVQLLDKHHPKPREADLRGFEWRYLRALSLGDPHQALPRQNASVHALASSPDGRRLAVGLRDRTRVFDLPTHQLLADLDQSGLSLAFLRNGQLLAVFGFNGVRLYNTSTWSLDRTFPEGPGSFAASANGSLLATQSRSGFRLWRTADWSTLAEFRDFRFPIAFSRDGTTLAASTESGIAVCNVAGLSPGRILEDSTNVFRPGGPSMGLSQSFVFSGDGTQLIAARNAASNTRSIFSLSIWDTSTGREIASLPADAEHTEHTSFITCLALSPDGRTLATASYDHSIRLWDIQDRKLLRTVQGHANEVWAATFSPDGSQLISGCKDGSIHLWPTASERRDALVPDGWAPISIAPDGRTIAALTNSSTLGLFRIAGTEPPSLFDLEPTPAPGPELRAPELHDLPPPDRTPDGHNRQGPPAFDRPSRPEAGPGPGRAQGPRGQARRRFSPIPSFALSDDFRTLAYTSGADAIRVVDTGTRESIALHTVGPWIDSMALSPDGLVLITASRDQTLRWWEPSRGTNSLLTTEGTRASFSSDGRFLLLVVGTNTVELWDVARRTVTRRLTIDPAPSFPLALSPDHRLLATTPGLEALDNAIYLWDTYTGRLVGTCTGHKQPVLALAFTPDNRTLASSGADSMIKFWNVKTQQELLSILRPGTTPARLIFTADGASMLATASWPFMGPDHRLFSAPAVAEPTGNR